MKQERALVWVVIVLAVGVAALSVTLYGVGVDTRNIAESNKQNAHSACLGGSQRSVGQLDIDYSIYEADLASAQSTHSSRSQRDIRGREATKILAGIDTIASNRVDVSVASQLPGRVAQTVLRTNFHCK